MMEYGFNQILLVKFITKFYAFEPNQELINQGIRFLGKIILELIRQNPQIQNLKHKNIENIVRTLLGQYSYRLGGIDDCLGAFGNFWTTYKQQIKNQPHLLSQEQIRKIIDPIKDQLMKISFYQQRTREFHPVSEEQMTNRKVQFLKTIIQIQEPVVTEPKKKRSYFRRNKQNSSSNGSKSMLSAGEKTRCDEEESMRTEDDEWTSIPLEKYSKTTHKTVGIFVIQESMDIEIDEPLKLKFQQSAMIDEQQENNNKLILRYEDFFPLKSLSSIKSNQSY